MPIKDYTSRTIDQLIAIDNRTAVITGGAQGIGFAIAKRFVEAGANVIIADIDNGNNLKNAEKELKKISHSEDNVITFKFDTRDLKEMKKVADTAIKKFGSLDIWVNDAGIYPTAHFLDIEENELREVLETNINGVFNGAQVAAQKMKEQKGGVIINLSSITGFNGLEEGLSHYCASKFAIRGLTASIAAELGKYNIRVVGIAPTLIETPGTVEQREQVKKESGEDTFKETKKEIPLGRIGQPDDIARVALFLASDMSAFISGTTIVVDGGNMCMG